MSFFCRFVIILGLLSGISCGSSDESDNDEAKEKTGTDKNELLTLDETKPEFTALPISLSGPLDGTTKIYGDLDCTTNSNQSEPYCFLPFGRKNGKNKSKIEGDFTFRPSAGVKVKAGFKGKIFSIIKNDDSEDYAIMISPNSDFDEDTQVAQYFIEYDHIEDIEVEEGDVVKADTELGTGSCQTFDNGATCSYYFFELMPHEQEVNTDENRAKAIGHPCPLDFFTSALKDKLEAALTDAQNAAFTTNTYAAVCEKDEVNN